MFAASATTKTRHSTLGIVWSNPALKRLEEIRSYVAKDKPEAAERLAIRIVAMAEMLRRHPHLGHRGAEAGMRELVIGGTPYVIVYQVRPRQILINTVWHVARGSRFE